MAVVNQAYPRENLLSQPGLPAEWRALRGIIYKEWLHFIRYPTWVFGLFIWPVLFPAMYIMSARALAGPNGGGLAMFSKLSGTADYIGYITVGTTVWMWQNTVLWGVGFALRNEQMRGTLESNWLSPTFRFSFLVGNSVTQLLMMFLYMAISFLQFALIYGVRFNINAGSAFLIILAAIPSIYGLAFVFASLVITAKEANTFIFLVRGLVMVFCGITFPILVMPGWMQSVSKWLPPSYIIHGMRKAMLEGAGFKEMLPDLIPLALFGIFWLVAGFTVFTIMDHRARKTGAIGQY